MGHPDDNIAFKEYKAQNNFYLADTCFVYLCFNLLVCNVGIRGMPCLIYYALIRLVGCAVHTILVRCRWLCLTIGGLMSKVECSFLRW